MFTSRLAALAVLALSACSAIVPSTAARLAALDPLTADPAALELVVILPSGLAVTPGSATLDLSADRGAEHKGGRFQLADHIHVTAADLADGLLLISLVREVPEALKPRKIAIGGQTAPTVIEHDAEVKKKGGKAA